MSTELTTAPQERALTVWAKPTTQEKIKALVPATMSFDRFARLTTSLIHRNPELANCEPVSFFACLSDCATIGVYPDPVTGQAYLIPRWNSKKQIKECTLLVGYKGLRTIALRSPDIVDIWTGVVRVGDTLKLIKAPRQEIIHEPLPDEAGEVIGYYSCSSLRGGGTSYEWMPVATVRKVRDEALAKIKEDWKREQSPWVTWEEEMGRKTVLRRHFKSLPLRPEDQEAVQRELDDDLKNVTGTAPEDGAAPPAGELPAARPKSPSRRGGAAAAKQVTTADAGADEDPTPPEPPPPAAAGDTTIEAEVTTVAAAPAAPAAESPPPARRQQQPPPSPAPEAPPDKTAAAPEIVPGVNFHGFHGKAWPQVLRLTIQKVSLAVTQAGKPLAKLQVATEGFAGEILTFEGVGIHDATQKPIILTPFLKEGSEIEANITAKLRPSKERDDAGKPKPDLTKPPMLFADSVSETTQVEQF
ncbi:recombinase RecT [Geminisphaera colitermitum]|uniref:recombinase RecT n=1 Tax=Geminisphaera colitermitum TaxID=1148786 RepID=UPI000158C6FE|nr:recombinase RecT [Geminisphaera colitermitum]